MSVYLSASSIRDFIVCSQRVLYRIKKPFPSVPNKEMIIGEVTHEVIEKGWRDRGLAMSLVEKAGYNKNLLSADIENIKFFVDIFFLNFSHYLAEDDLIEYSFKLNLYDDVFLVGKMDRISNGNVFDWKTTARPPKRLDNDVQSIIYNYAYESLFKEKAASVNVASLSKGILIPYIRSEMHERELFDRIIPKMIRAIRNEWYEKSGLFNGSCYRCSYKLGCLGGTNVVVGSEFIE